MIAGRPLHRNRKMRQVAYSAAEGINDVKLGVGGSDGIDRRM